MQGTDASWSQRPQWLTADQRPLPLALARGTALAMLALVALLGLLVLVRRVSGALVEPPPPLALLATGGALAAFALLCRGLLVFPAAARDEARPWAIKLSLAVSLVLALWAVGLSVAGAGGGMLAYWGLLLVAEGLSWELLRHQAAGKFLETAALPVVDSARPPACQETSAQPLPASALSTPMHLQTADIELQADSCEEAAGTQRDEGLLQQLTRRRLDDGCEVLEGWLRVELTAGQRHAAAHVAICPPLAGQPVCYAEQSDGPDAQIKVAQVLPHGARLEVKLDRPQSEASHVDIEFSIQPAAADEGL
jgi:hypothetical protein